jgi:alpha-mannosidase
MDQTVTSTDDAKVRGSFDLDGRSLPAEMLPSQISFGDIAFKLSSLREANDLTSHEQSIAALTARGQKISLPEGKFNRLYLLAASYGGDQKASFRIGDNPVDLTIQDWSGFIGQWDNRIWNKKQEIVPLRPGAPGPLPGAAPRTRTVMEFAGLTPGFIKSSPVAWFASHRHTPEGKNDYYAYSYLYAYAIDVPADARTLTLPENGNVRILAITVADENGEVHPAQPLYDTLEVLQH